VFLDDTGNFSNDLVVPERGVYARNGHPSFPLLNPLRYKPGDHVWHSGFFRRSETFDAIKRHFDLPAAVPALSDIIAGGDVRPDRDLVVADERPRRRRGGLRGTGLRGTRSSEAMDVSPMRGGLESAPAEPPPGEARPAAAEPAFRADRDAVIDFHEKVKEGEEKALVVRLEDAIAAAARSGRISIVFRPGEDDIALDVVLRAPGFDIVGANHATMRVTRQHDPASETVSFLLKALGPGEQPKTQRIVAEFWHGNNPIGETTHNTTVVPAGYDRVATGGESVPPTPIHLSSERREDCDLSITLRGEDTKFAISLRCWTPGEAYQDKDAGMLSFKSEDFPLYTHQIIDAQFSAYPAASLDDDAFDKALIGWNANFMQYLRNFGKKLWTMLPDEFRAEYLRLRTSVRSIVVYSPELIFPWELVRPFETAGGKYQEYDFLGAAHVLGRWQRKLALRPKQQRWRISGFVIMRPRYKTNDLDWADDEVKALKGMVAHAEEMRPVDNAAMMRLLERNNVQMVHYTGHGDYQANADLNSLRLEDGPFPALSFIGTRLGQEAQPILYLNACSVGKAAPVAGQMGGFAANCLSGGWSGLIAPYWLINDDRAATFSQSLYAKLKLNRSIGEALQELRLEHSGDPTYLAYSYIGDPWARPIFV
jgi:CHAT domain-containing protein